MDISIVGYLMNMCNRRTPTTFLCLKMLGIGIVWVLSFTSQAQFRPSETHDWGIVGGAVGARLIYMIAEHKLEADEPFRGKGVPRILGFDKAALGNSSYHAARVSDWFLYTSLAGMALGGMHAREGLYLGLQTMAVTDLTNLMIKNLVRRRRPFTYQDNLSQEDYPSCKKYNRRDYDATLSFYSGHTAQVAAFSYFTLSMVWFTSTYYRESGKDWVYVVGGAIPALTGYLRIRAGKHFPSDVIVGYLAGAAAGYFVPKWHKGRSEVHSTSGLNDKLGLALLSGTGTGVALAIISKLVGKPKHTCNRGLAYTPRKNMSKMNLSINPQIGMTTGLNMTLTL